jgi:tRNA modification GTPase
LFHAASGRSLSEQSCDKILFGRWQSVESGEEVVACRRGPQQVELHCHGGHAAAAAIINSLAAQGCQEASWRQSSGEAADDPIASAALQALAAAPTVRTAAILWDQFNGALRRALDDVAREIAAHHGNSALEQLDDLLEWSAVGLHLVTPWKVVLAGRPNVGKSSLINVLLGYERAIVHHIPGTTRDVVTAITALDGWPVELADTAGLHASSDPVESAGIRLAGGHLAMADLVVLVFDASEGPTEADLALARDWPQAFQVANKRDLAAGEQTALGSASLAVSAKTSLGIEALAHELVCRLVPSPPTRGQGMPFSPDQVSALRQVRAAVAAQQWSVAAKLLADCGCRT